MKLEPNKGNSLQNYKKDILLMTNEYYYSIVSHKVSK